VVRVAVDAMGGDHAPDEIVAGAVRASRDLGIHVLLVGRSDEVHRALQTAGAQPGAGLEVIDAPSVIAMDERDPARAVRSNPDSSVAVAARLVRDGLAEAMVSAGATGAAMAAGVLGMGRVRGVPRPAITVVLPFGDSPTVLVDAGANVDVRPEHLASFGVLGSVFAQVTLGIEDPRVGLLSVGEEDDKGSELSKAAFPLLGATGVRFVGNVEGRDIASDRVDVVVTDGFTGNVVLKLLEGFAKFLMVELLKIFDATDETRKAGEVVLPGLLDLRARLSPETYGGAHLLGVRGVCIICHGSSDAQATCAAIEIAARTVSAGLVTRVAERLGGRARDGGSAGPSGENTADTAEGMA
jgi:glycerol-3-phosphate acyltransferase PlsX